MMSPARVRLYTQVTFKMVWGNDWSLWSLYKVFLSTDHFTGSLGANMIEHVFKKELYIILLPLEKNLQWIGQF